VKRIWLLTGEPGVGKTTVLLRLVDELKREGVKIMGFYTVEERVQGVRSGFRIVDVSAGQSYLMASTTVKSDIRFGKYYILKEALTFGAKLILRALEEADLVACDELGPMELLSKELEEAFRRMLRSGKPVVGVVHRKMEHPLLREVRARSDVEIFRVDFSNRNTLSAVLKERVLAFLKEAH